MYINRGGNPLKNPQIPSSLKISRKASVAPAYLYSSVGHSLSAREVRSYLLTDLYRPWNCKRVFTVSTGDITTAAVTRAAAPATKYFESKTSSSWVGNGNIPSLSRAEDSSMQTFTTSEEERFLEPHCNCVAQRSLSACFMEYPLGLSDEGFVAKMMQSDILHRGQQITAHHEIQDLAEPLLSLAAGFTKRKRTPDHAEKEQEDPTAFVQQVKKRRRINEEDDTAVWEARFSELREFREKFGHCRVPQAWKENKKLGSWVARVRNQKRKNKLKEDRIKALEDLGIACSD